VRNFPAELLARNPEAALKGIRKTVAEVVEDLKQNRETVPEPIATKRYSGKFMVRVRRQFTETSQFKLRKPALLFESYCQCAS